MRGALHARRSLTIPAFIGILAGVGIFHVAVTVYQAVLLWR